MTETTVILSVSTSVADKVLAENCAYFLNDEMSFCHCVCPARLEFNENSTDVTVKSEYSDANDRAITQVQIAARAFLFGYLQAQH